MRYPIYFNIYIYTYGWIQIIHWPENSWKLRAFGDCQLHPDTYQSYSLNFTNSPCTLYLFLLAKFICPHYVSYIYIHTHSGNQTIYPSRRISTRVYIYIHIYIRICAYVYMCVCIQVMQIYSHFLSHYPLLLSIILYVHYIYIITFTSQIYIYPIACYIHGNRFWIWMLLPMDISYMTTISCCY